MRSFYVAPGFDQAERQVNLARSPTLLLGKEDNLAASPLIGRILRVTIICKGQLLCYTCWAGAVELFAECFPELVAVTGELTQDLHD